MISTRISKVSAGVLLVGGLAFLFGSDTIVPLFAPDVPGQAAWLGELIGAGWLALAGLNWLSRGAVLGGIYGRPVVLANLALYFMTAMVLLRVAFEQDAATVLRLAAFPALILAGVYGWLLLRGPLEGDIARSGDH